MTKLIWLDVGTHAGQEFDSVFASDFIFYMKFIKRSLIDIYRGNFSSELIQSFRNSVRARMQIKNLKGEIVRIGVEANPKIVTKYKIYRQIDMVFNLGLKNGSDFSSRIEPLFIGNGDLLSQGSSLYKEKHNVSQALSIPVFAVDPTRFLTTLDEYLRSMFEDFVVFLRLNCEGAEDEVIFTAHTVFADRLCLLGGSLKDVKDVKGDDAYHRLIHYLESQALPFYEFNGNCTTWGDAHSALALVLGQLEKPT